MTSSRRPSRAARAGAAMALVMSASIVGPACGDVVEVDNPRVTLALDFGANALLELFVVETSSAACASLLAGELAPDDEGVVQHAAEARPAQGLNDGGQVRFELEELPAEVPLTFYARAKEGVAVLSQDCEDGVVIPPDGHVDLELVVSEVP